MFGMIKALIITCSLMAAQPPPDFRSPVDFFAEIITMKVGENDVSINGIYYFRNNISRDIFFPIVFPFYIDSLTAFPEKIEPFILSGSDTTRLNYETLIERDCIRMRIPMGADSVTVWRLNYRQKLRSNRARYILTSTSTWKKPLEEATYRFIVPNSYDINFAWPEADSVLTGNEATLISHRTNFMPERDMEIIWERK